MDNSLESSVRDISLTEVFDKFKLFLIIMIVFMYFSAANLFSQRFENSVVFDSVYNKGLFELYSDPGISKNCLEKLENHRKQFSPIQQAQTNYLRLKVIYADTNAVKALDKRMFEAPDSLGHNDALIYSARKFLEKSMPDKAIHLLMEALDTLKAGSEKADYCSINLCEAYRQKQEYAKGIEMLNEIVNSRRYVTDNNRAYAYNRLAAIYDEWGVNKYNIADSVEKYSVLCISLSEKTGSKANLALAQNELSYRFSLAKKYDEALELSLKAVKNFDEAGMKYYAMSALINQSNIYIGLTDYKLALLAVVDATNLCAIEENRNLFMRLYLQMAIIYNYTGNYKEAYEFMALSRLLMSDFYKDRISMQINEQSAKYDLFAKEQKIREGEQKNEFHKKQLTFLIIIMIFLCIAFVLSLFYFKLKRKEILKQKLFEAVIQTEEKERKRIASDLHDGLGPLLSAAKLYFQAYIDANDIDNKTVIESKLISIIDSAIDDTSRISHNISPQILEKYGLKIALENFISEIDFNKSIQFDLFFEKIDRFDLKAEITIYRTILELIHNTIKHAKASQISIKVFLSRDTLNVQYEDNGIGFSIEEKLNEKQGMGLKNIKNRIQSLEGNVLFNSRQNQGMKAVISIPHKEISMYETN
ncbi:MAG: tetratricopeptide repeat-containing sensor histidine kinase [Bacteroidales bacterium]